MYPITGKDIEKLPDGRWAFSEVYVEKVAKIKIENEEWRKRGLLSRAFHKLF